MVDVVLLMRRRKKRKKKTTVDDIQSHLLEIFKQSCKGCLVFCLLLIKELIAVPSAPMLNPLAEASAPFTLCHKFDLLKKK